MRKTTKNESGSVGKRRATRASKRTTAKPPEPRTGVLSWHAETSWETGEGDCRIARGDMVLYQVGKVNGSWRMRVINQTGAVIVDESVPTMTAGKELAEEFEKGSK